MIKFDNLHLEPTDWDRSAKGISHLPARLQDTVKKASVKILIRHRGKKNLTHILVTHGKAPHIGGFLSLNLIIIPAIHDMGVIHLPRHRPHVHVSEPQNWKNSFILEKIILPSCRFNI
jgi:hypothetical protein